MRKIRNNDNSDAPDDWVVTYGDMVTLLLAFFVLLFSFSEVDAQKWQELVKTFTGRDVVVVQQGSSSSDSIMETSSFIMPDFISRVTNQTDELEEEEEEEEEQVVSEKQKIINKQFDALYDILLQHSEDEGNIFQIVKTEDQIRIRLSSNILFEPNKAVINSESYDILTNLAVLIKDHLVVLDKIVMEGNTDNLPINSSLYRDNFELSLERALAVLYFFKYETDYDERMLMPLGYGEYNPISDNDTAEGRAKNRRTDIVLVRKNIDKQQD